MIVRRFYIDVYQGQNLETGHLWIQDALTANAKPEGQKRLTFSVALPDPVELWGPIDVDTGEHEATCEHTWLAIAGKSGVWCAHCGAVKADKQGGE